MNILATVLLFALSQGYIVRGLFLLSSKMHLDKYIANHFRYKLPAVGKVYSNYFCQDKSETLKMLYCHERQVVDMLNVGRPYDRAISLLKWARCESYVSILTA